MPHGKPPNEKQRTALIYNWIYYRLGQARSIRKCKDWLPYCSHESRAALRDLEEAATRAAEALKQDYENMKGKR